MGAFGFRATLNFLHAAVGSTVMILYPLYASTKAMEKPASKDLQQWMTYWVLFSLLTLFELYLSSIISWIPVWASIKLVFCMWLVWPTFKGAAYIYENTVMKFIQIESKEKPSEKEEEDESSDEEEDESSDKEEEDESSDKGEEDESSDKEEEDEDDEEKKIFQAWKLVDDYIDKNGADALEKIVKDALQDGERTNKQKET